MSDKHIRIVSFAVKYGKPDGAIHVADLRKRVRNPYKVKDLKGLTGLDPKVQAFVARCFASVQLLKNLNSLVNAYAVTSSYPMRTIAIGCSNGKQRSVALAEMVAAQVKDNIKVKLEHRDLERNS